MENVNNHIKGYVFNIQRYTIHDGPGIRTEIFLKGCPLRCKWCSNPESLKTHPQIGVYASRCIGIEVCGKCMEACPHGGEKIFSIQEGKISGINRDICTNCLKCADDCPANALMVWGKTYTVQEILDIVLSDVEFYEKSGGGVTLSGGDPLVQWKFARAVLQTCKSHGIHTCIETELSTSRHILDKVLPYADLIITDIKHMDPRKHKEFTGVDNVRILENIVHIVKAGKQTVIRTPVVPGHNDGRENIEATSEFIRDTLGNNVTQVQLLPYRPLGLEKYKSLGLSYGMADFQAPERSVWEKNILSLVEVMKSYGVPAVPGSSSKI